MAIRTLTWFRATIYMQKGDLATAKKCVQNAMAAEPDSPLVQSLKPVLLADNKLPASRPVAGLDLSESPQGEPAGDAEAKAFAEAFAKSVMANETETVHAALDLAAVFRRAMAGVTIPEEAPRNTSRSLRWVHFRHF